MQNKRNSQSSKKKARSVEKGKSKMNVVPEDEDFMDDLADVKQYMNQFKLNGQMTRLD